MTAPLEKGASPLDRRDDSGWGRGCGAHTETENRGKEAINLLGMQQFFPAVKGLRGSGEPPCFYLVLQKDLRAELCILALNNDWPILLFNRTGRGSNMELVENQQSNSGLDKSNVNKVKSQRHELM